MKKIIEFTASLAIWFSSVTVLMYIGYNSYNDTISNISIDTIASIAVGAYAIMNTASLFFIGAKNIHDNDKLQMLFIENKKFILALFGISLFYEIKILINFL